MFHQIDSFIPSQRVTPGGCKSTNYRQPAKLSGVTTLAFLLSILFARAPLVFSETVYRSINPDGVVSYSDIRPLDNSYEELSVNSQAPLPDEEVRQRRRRMREFMDQALSVREAEQAARLTRQRVRAKQDQVYLPAQPYYPDYYPPYWQRNAQNPPQRSDTYQQGARHSHSQSHRGVSSRGPHSGEGPLRPENWRPSQHIQAPPPRRRLPEVNVIPR